MWNRVIKQLPFLIGVSCVLSQECPVTYPWGDGLQAKSSTSTKEASWLSITHFVRGRSKLFILLVEICFLSPVAFVTC